MKPNNKQIVLEAVIDLHNKETPASRTTICQTTGIKQSTVDECLKALANDEHIYRLCNGVYAPIAQHPASRIISKIVLPDGTVKIDIGDDVLTLTPKEARTLGSLLLAEATDYGNHMLSNRFAEQNTILHNRIKVLEKQLASQSIINYP